MIEFGISLNYVSNWGTVQAIREIYQNFIDYGDYDVEVIPIDDTISKVTLKNTFKPTSWEFLKIGFSKKNDGAIGKHGEGLKLAGLVFKRQDLFFTISNCLGTAIPDLYHDEYIGKSYGLDITDETTDDFIVSFHAHTESIKIFVENKIETKDILHTCYYGSIVNKPKGNIYVGDLYVCNMPDFNYAFNFKPAFVSLDRDREIPSHFDVGYYANKIIQASQNLQLRASDIHNVEYTIGSIPSRLASKFRPVMTDKGLQMHSGKTVVTNMELVNKIASHAEIIKKVQKLKYQVLFKTKKTPLVLIEEFRKDLCQDNSSTEAFENLLKLAKNWKNK